MFIAVPNSDATPENATFNIAELAMAAARNFGPTAGCFTGLRFKTAIPKDERDHRLSVSELRANMVAIGAPGPGTPILLDDVFTQGFHITACVLTLPERTRPKVALMAARTLKIPPADPWEEISETHYCFG